MRTSQVRRWLLTALLSALALWPGVAAQADLPAALVAMADAERAFSRRAADASWRDAFIEFFADEAVNFQPGPGPARERLRALPAPKPGTPSFQWEPRTGDVAASGDLGYLTGPVRYPPGPDGKARHGCYFSVWKRQADGTFKVILDVGIESPSAPPFAPGFLRVPGRAVAVPAGSRADAERTLLAADKAFSDALDRQGAAAAFGGVLHAGARLHRNGFLPLTSRDTAVTWLQSHVTAMTSEPMKSETGASGDLGYTWGKAVVTGTDGKPAEGYYVRLWTLGEGDRWQLVADITPA